MRNYMIIIALLALSACGPSVEAPTEGAPVCFSSTPEAGGDTSLCGIADGGPYIPAGNPAPYIVTECDRPAPNPYPLETECAGVPHDGGRVWCCVPGAK